VPSRLALPFDTVLLVIGALLIAGRGRAIAPYQIPPLRPPEERTTNDTAADA
jgi:hypothetical protein